MKQMAYSQEEIDQAAAVDIVGLAQEHGMELTNETERFYRLVKHDSLVIDRAKNYFHWNSQGFGGNSIKFAQTFLTDQSKPDSARFKDAVALLLNNKNLSASEVTYQHTPYVFDSRKVSPDFSQAKKYLTEQRGLSPSLVDNLHEEGLIQQNKSGSVLFLWRDPETKEVMGSSIQGTQIDHERYGKRGTFKRIDKDSTTGYGFSVGPKDADTLHFFESSIDLVSYLQLKGRDPRAQYVSMEGLKNEVISHYLADNLNARPTVPDKIVLNVDNDAAGQRFSDQYLLLSWIDRRNGKELAVERELPGDEQIPLAQWRDYEQSATKHGVNPYVLYAIDKASSNLQPGTVANGQKIHTPFTDNDNHRVATEAVATLVPANFSGSSLSQWAEMTRSWNEGNEAGVQRFGLKCQHYYNQATQGVARKIVRDNEPRVKDWNDITKNNLHREMRFAPQMKQKGLERE